jgi:hypothetical protein
MGFREHLFSRHLGEQRLERSLYPSRYDGPILSPPYSPPSLSAAYSSSVECDHREPDKGDDLCTSQVRLQLGPYLPLQLMHMSVKMGAASKALCIKSKKVICVRLSLVHS